MMKNEFSNPTHKSGGKLGGCRNRSTANHLWHRSARASLSYNIHFKRDGEDEEDVFWKERNDGPFGKLNDRQVWTKKGRQYWSRIKWDRIGLD